MQIGSASLVREIEQRRRSGEQTGIAAGRQRKLPPKLRYCRRPPPHSHSIILSHGNALTCQRKFFPRTMKNRLPNPSEICALDHLIHVLSCGYCRIRTGGRHFANGRITSAKARSGRRSSARTSGPFHSAATYVSLPTTRFHGKRCGRHTLPVTARV